MANGEFPQSDAFLAKELLSLAFESWGIAVFKVDPRTRQAQLTSAMRQILELEAEPYFELDRFFDLIHPDDAPEARAALAAAIAMNRPGECAIEFRIVTSAGKTKWVAVRGRPVFGNGAGVFIGTVQDITDSKKAAAALEEAVQQRELLLHEVNHRVRNSLQLVSSLLRLQARRIADEVVRRQFEDTTTRISAIAHVHQRLYRDRDIKRINFGAFVSELCADLQGASPHCSLKVDSPTLYVITDRAVPLALVVNELVTNAFKYAYPDGGGPVSVTITQPSPAEIRITVSDSGVGLPEGFSVENENSLGMILIASMLNQLSGRIEIQERAKGAIFAVTAPTENGGA